MTIRNAQHSYTIKEASSLTGLPSSTLRYYESIGIINPVSRGTSSKHRVYDDSDLDQLTRIACLAATGMSINDMRAYVSNGLLGPSAATEQVALLEAQERRLADEAEQVALRQRYVRLKIGYWLAVQAGDTDRADVLSNQARALTYELKQSKNA